MRSVTVATMAAVMLCGVWTMAEDKAAAPVAPAAGAAAAADVQKPKAPEVPATEMTLTGTVFKKEVQNKKGVAVAMYFLKTEDGKDMKLQVPKVAKGATTPAINLADFVDAKVKVKAMGTETESKGKKFIHLKNVLSIEKVAAETKAAQ